MRERKSCEAVAFVSRQHVCPAAEFLSLEVDGFERFEACGCIIIFMTN